MWDFFKYLLDKISLKEGTMFLVFLLLSYVFMPVEITELMRDKTPPLFQSWFHLGDLLNITVSLVLYLICKPLLSTVLDEIEYRKQKALLESLSDEEMEIVYALMKNHFEPQVFDSNAVVMSLLSKRVIMLSSSLMGVSRYVLMPTFQTCYLREFRKSCEREE